MSVGMGTVLWVTGPLSWRMTHGEDVLADRMESSGVPAECLWAWAPALGHRATLLEHVTHGEDVLAGRVERDIAAEPIEQTVSASGALLNWDPGGGFGPRRSRRPVAGKAAGPDITGWRECLSPGFLADELIKHTH